MARLYADEDFPYPVVEWLRQSGHDVLTTLEAGRANQGFVDEDQLSFATTQNRAILTRNRRHFERLHRRSSQHGGIISITDDPDFPDQAARIDAALFGIDDAGRSAHPRQSAGSSTETGALTPGRSLPRRRGRGWRSVCNLELSVAKPRRRHEAATVPLLHQPRPRPPSISRTGDDRANIDRRQLCQQRNGDQNHDPGRQTRCSHYGQVDDRVGQPDD